MRATSKRVALIVSHPIQYYAPLYKRLADRDDLAIKVFFTWHDGKVPVQDRGFRVPVAWDIALTEGYDFELVPDVSSDPGTHHFLGLNNPTLVSRILAWAPDVVHITGWAWLSHLVALRTFYRRGIPILFRGDSHLLDEGTRGFSWYVKRHALRCVFSWPTAFLVVGSANRAYYEAFGVQSDRLYDCPHSIDVGRFAQSAAVQEEEAGRWRQELGIASNHCVVLYAGKFEPRKRPIELMHAVSELPDRQLVLVMVGAGELDAEVRAFATRDPTRFIILPFQNQSRMPMVYRLGDLFVLPSAFGETWGLAVNEALACGRPVLVSDRVGCAADVVDQFCGQVFSWDNPLSLLRSLHEMTKDRNRLLEMGRCAVRRAWSFDIERTEGTLVDAVRRLCHL
jgi:glycosyltransferase involved in cell wall biosynthesis